jgi:hypothetical protein
MTQTALTIVGYAVGSYFGYPQLGAIVGAYVGAQVAAKDVVGPRINDTQQQQSSYGAAIPKTYGGNRIAGTLIWAGPMQNIEHSESGKGGPSITTYTAVRSFAILVGEGPVVAIRRMWADTKLILDYSDAADSAAQMESAKTAAMMAFYPGDEAQMPDPTIEAVEGAGNVPPYRGSSYFAMTDFPLTDYGNRIPVFTFELSNFPNAYAGSDTLEPLVVFPWTQGGGGGPPQHSLGDTSWHNSVPPTGGGTSLSFDAAAALTAAAGVAYGVFWSPSAAYSTRYVDIYTDSANPVYNVEPSGANAEGDDAQYVYARIAVERPEQFRIVMPDPSVGDDWLVLSVGVKTWVNYGIAHSGEVIAYRHPAYSVFVGAPPPISGAYQTTYASGSLPGSMAYLVRGNPVLQVRGERVPTHAAKTCFPGDPCQSANGLAEVPGDPTYCVTCDGEFTPNYPWTIVSGVAKQLAAIEYRAGALYQNGLGPVLLPGDPHYADAAWWADQRAAAITAGTLRADVTSPVVVASYAQRGAATLTTVPEGSADLADIVLDICLATGQLTADQVDVTALEHREVLGFTRARRAPARALIEPLRTAYFFDLIEDGDVIRAVMRGGDAAATLTEDDLAAGIDNAETEAIEPDRAQEEELPNGVDVLYISRTVDYQSAVQSARRRVGGSTEQNGTELAVVLTDAHAAQVAEVLLFLSWLGRTRRTLKTWRGHTGLQPSDMIRIAYKGRIYLVRAEETSEQDGILTIVGVDDDPDAYRSVVAGVTPSGGGSAILIVGPTRTVLLDIPLLRQEDDGPGMYLAASGYRAEWRGARVYRSTDDGASYATFQDVKRAAIMGHADGVLADWTRGNTVDETNTVIVEVLGAGTLSSITRAQLLNEGNPAVLGDEIIQFQRAELLSPRTYKLSGLLRGRRGTERYTGTHADGERFVLLDATRIYRPGFELSNVGVQLLYRAISFGDLVGGDGLPFTNTAVGLMPLSPVHLAVARWPTGGYKAKWVRRSRYPSPIVDGVGAPLGEATESYRVRVLSGGAVIESHTVSTPEVLLGVAAGTGPTLTIETTFVGDAQWMAPVDSAGDIVGVARNAGVSLYHFTARKWDGTTGAIAEESADLGEVIQACHAGGQLYAVAATYSGVLYSAVTLYRFDYGDLTTPAATRPCTDPAILGFQGVAHDGTDLWVVAQDVQELQRCNPTTLARVDGYSYAPDQAFRVYAAAGWIWLQMITSGNVRLVRVDPADGSFVDSLPISTFAGVFGLSASRVFIIAGGVRQYDATTSPPTLLSTFTRASPALQLTSGAVVDGLLYVGEQGIDVLPGVHVFDMATGGYLGNTQNVLAAMPAGGRDAQLLSSGGSNQSYALDVTELATTDLDGMTLEVCQISGTVGAGFPATITIPGGSAS